MAQQIIDAVKAGHLDGYLTAFDDAVTDRVNAQIAADQKKARAAKTASASSDKKVAPPPRKPSAAKGAAKVTPVKDTIYKVSASFKKLAGAQVQFIRHKDGDVAKSVIAMVTDKPGAPVGKRTVIPTNALEEMPVSASKKKTVARKK